jgi:N-acetylneuraminic acid mutarotase/uncharacterized GH25 family protein
MIPRFLSLVVALATAAASQAHFVFAVPQADGKTVRVVFSDDLEPDEHVAIEKIAKLKLEALLADGKSVELPLKQEKHHLEATLGTGKPQVLFGSFDYAVLQKGTDKPYLLKYHPQAIVRGCTPSLPSAAIKAPIQIIPLLEAAGVRFQVIVDGKPKADVEVNVVLPAGSEDGKKAKAATDKDGRTQVFSHKGHFGAWAKHAETKAGEFDGKKYGEIRHYASLTVDVSATRASSIPALPEAFSSFGAATLDGYVYVYGGHAGKTHSYSKQTTLGKFRRLKIDEPAKGWEELAGGTRLQGLALVAHAGKLYRIGGMEPRNAPTEKSDNHSVATAQVFDPKTGQWSNLPDLPGGRSSHDAVVVDNTLYVVGGWCMKGSGAPSTWHETALSLDLADPSAVWKEFAQPFSRRALTAAAFDGKVYVIAGLTAKGGSGAMGGMERGSNIYDPKAGKWTAGPTLPEGRMNGFTPASVVVGDQLLVNPADGKIYRMKGDQWEAVSQVAVPRWVHRAVPFGEGKAFILGGATADGNTGEGEVVSFK